LPNFVPYTRHQLKAVLGEIQASIYTSLVPLEITAWRTAEPVSFSERFSFTCASETGRKTGFWLEELAAPYYEFKDAGAQITLASPKGGRPPLDPKSQDPSFQTDITRRFAKDADAETQLDKTMRLQSVKQEERHCLLSGRPRPNVGSGRAHSSCHLTQSGDDASIGHARKL
jgi:hypothetical protein